MRIRTRPEGSAVLVVDDEPLILDLCKQYLRGVESLNTVITASAAMDALRKLNNQSFGLIILDVNLPDKSGLYAVNQMMKNNSVNPKNIILITGAISEEIVSTAAKMGVSNIVLKPFNKEKLLDKVRSVLGKVS